MHAGSRESSMKKLGGEAWSGWTHNGASAGLGCEGCACCRGARLGGVLRQRNECLFSSGLHSYDLQTLGSCREKHLGSQMNARSEVDFTNGDA